MIGTLKGTLTRQYQIHDLVIAAGEVRPGMTKVQAQGVLDTQSSPHSGLAPRLFAYEQDQVVEDELLRACHEQRDDAELLVWTAMLLADPRIAGAVEQYLTDPTGAFDGARFRSDTLTTALDHAGIGSANKVASNILRYIERAGLVKVRRHGAAIVGIAALPPPGMAVPGIVRLVSERAPRLEPALGPTDLADPVEFAINRGVNRWVGLTADDFRAAAVGAVPEPPPIDPEDEDLNRFKPKDDSDYTATIEAKQMVKTRRHETLVNDYTAWVMNRVDGAKAPHPVDLLLHRAGTKWLIEAKVVYKGNATVAVRSVIGQVFTYRHMLYRGVNPSLIGLFTEPIGDAYVELLDSLDIISVWRDDDSWAGSQSAVAIGLADHT